MNREQVMGEVSNDLSIYTSGDSSLEDGSDDEFGLPHPNCSSHDNFLHTQYGDESTALHNPNYSSLDIFLETSDTQSRDETATLETSIEILNNLATENNDPLSFINEDATKNTSSIKSRHTMQRDASTENRHLAHDINEYSEELKAIQAFLENYNESRSLENDQDEMNTNDYVSYMETNASSPNAVRNTFLYCLRTNDAHLADRLLRDIGIEYIIRHCMVYDGIFTTRHDAKSADDDLTRQTSCTNMFWLCSFYGSSDVMKMLIEECWIFFVEEETGGVVEPCQEVEDRADLAMSSLLNDDVESYGCTPLFIAAAQNHASIINVLLEHKVNPDAVNGVGSTAAIVAASMDNLSALEALGETKSVVVDFNKANRDDITPLLAASQYGSVECVRYLTHFTGPTDERIVNCKVHNSKGLGCAAVAAKNNKHKVVDFFCQINDLNSERGIDINQSTRDEGNTVLHIAALYNSKETMQALLQMIPREIDPLRRNKDGMTALHIAASQGHVEIVKEFVNCLRDEMKELDTADKIGMTPLFYGTYGFSLFSSN